MAYNKTYDEENPDGLTNTTAGTHDAPNSVIEWQSQLFPSYVIAQKNSFSNPFKIFSSEVKNSL